MSEFKQWTLTHPVTFDLLSRSVKLRSVARGRQGNVLVNPYQRGVPIVRTTTIYEQPAQFFAQLHTDLSTQIMVPMVSHLGLRFESVDFNNALIEIYTSKYTRMGFHSDQALDLKEDSWIAIYSCYENLSDNFRPRTLVVRNKMTGKMTRFQL